MTQPIVNASEGTPAVANDKEYNFAQMRKQLDQERQARIQAEERVAHFEKTSQQKSFSLEEEDDSEPYVDHKKLKKTLSQFGQQNKQETADIVQQEVQKALSEERKQNWIKNNPDFNSVMESSTIQKFAEADPELAESILQMPDGFERQKLVYRNIKALGLDKPAPKQSSVQDKIDANRRSPFYQPSGVGSAPYHSAGDFSDNGQKNAYSKMQELKNRLRLG